MAAHTHLARHTLPRERPALLLLHDSPAHGYDLRERLRALGFSRDDRGRLYRAPRGLASRGLVRSTWETSTGGPGRRRYELTPADEKRLRDTAAELRAMYDILGASWGRRDTCPALHEAPPRAWASHVRARGRASGRVLGAAVRIRGMTKLHDVAPGPT